MGKQCSLPANPAEADSMILINPHPDRKSVVLKKDVGIQKVHPDDAGSYSL